MTAGTLWWRKALPAASALASSPVKLVKGDTSHDTDSAPVMCPQFGVLSGYLLVLRSSTSRKWESIYLVLVKDVLFGYKDQASYAASKPELFKLSLGGGLVHPERGRVRPLLAPPLGKGQPCLRVRAHGTQLLLTSETDETAEAWQMALIRAATPRVRGKSRWGSGRLRVSSFVGGARGWGTRNHVAGGGLGGSGRKAAPPLSAQPSGAAPAEALKKDGSSSNTKVQFAGGAAPEKI